MLRLYLLVSCITVTLARSPSKLELIEERIDQLENALKACTSLDLRKRASVWLCFFLKYLVTSFNVYKIILIDFDYVVKDIIYFK